MVIFPLLQFFLGEIKPRSLCVWSREVIGEGGIEGSKHAEDRFAEGFLFEASIFGEFGAQIVKDSVDIADIVVAGMIMESACNEAVAEGGAARLPACSMPHP